MLEEGATTLSKEESGRLAAHQMKFIRNLEMALVRIENKTYGICKTTGKLIPKERLMKVLTQPSASRPKKDGFTKGFTLRTNVLFVWYEKNPFATTGDKNRSVPVRTLLFL